MSGKGKVPKRKAGSSRMFRPCLKNGNMLNGEIFFAKQSQFSLEYCMYSKENWKSMADKLTIFKQGLKG